MKTEKIPEIHREREHLDGQGLSRRVLATALHRLTKWYLMYGAEIETGVARLLDDPNLINQPRYIFLSLRLSRFWLIWVIFRQTLWQVRFCRFLGDRSSAYYGCRPRQSLTLF